ncbi:hypothetical protein [Azospirillum sp. B2RO_4]|uniref:hypothetical protein n=1 Tax=Azospirillum sp. B2RO_4 TaxID=3027796 RepID=UPI003DA853CC
MRSCTPTILRGRLVITPGVCFKIAEIFPHWLWFPAYAVPRGATVGTAAAADAHEGGVGRSRKSEFLEWMECLHMPWSFEAARIVLVIALGLSAATTWHLFTVVPFGLLTMLSQHSPHEPGGTVLPVAISACATGAIVVALTLLGAMKRQLMAW